MSRQVRQAKKFARGRHFLMAALVTMVAIGVGLTAGSGSFSANAATTPVNGDATCGYNGTSQFTESTVVRWAQVNGQGSAAQFIAYANDENSTLLGVNTATPDTTSPQHSSNASGGDPTQHDAFGRPYYPALYITNTTLHPLGTPASGNSLGTGVGDWQQGGTPKNLSGGAPFVNDVFGVWVVGTQSVNPSSGQVGTLTAALNNGQTYPTGTLLSVTALSHSVASGDTIVITNTASPAKTQNLKASAAAAAGATSIAVTSFKANAAYGVGSSVVDSALAVAGNYARQANLPTSNTNATTWNLGSGSDAPVGNTFANMGSEGYGTEFRWNVNALKDSDGNALSAGNVYKIQIIEHDGDQNKGGDSGEYCAQVSFPGVSTTATGGQIQPDGTATVSDSATVTGVTTPLSGTNKVTFNVYGPDPTPGSNPSDDCSGTPQTKDVALNSTTPNKAYPSGDFTVNAPGDYHFTANLTVNGTVTASSACGATGETATVTSRPTSLTTDAGGPYAPPTSLSDTATLSGGTSNAGGTLTFTLFADSSGACGTQLGQTQVTVNNGADGKQYTGTINAPTNPGFFVPGTYHWMVSYGGDPATGNDASSDSATCPAADSTTPANHENPVVLSPSITIDKSQKSQTIEASGNGELTAAAGVTPGTANWTITVTNNGTAPLTHVVITDSLASSLAPDCNRTAAQTATLIQGVGNNDSTFDPTESFNYTCSLTGLTGTSFHNVIDVVATSGGNTNVTSQDFANVTIINPHIQVAKTPASQSVPLGGTANFTITVSNDGDTPLSGVTVSDVQAAGCAQTAAQTAPEIAAQGNNDNNLDPGESFSYSCSKANVQTAFTNAAGACGVDSLSGTVCDNDGNNGTPTSDCTTAGGHSADQCATVNIESMTSDQDFKPKDTAHLSGLSNTPNGNVTFSLFKDPAGVCTLADRIYTDTVPVTANGDYSTTSAQFLSALVATVPSLPQGTGGNYNWQISYTGDTNGNADINGACGTENFQVANG